MHSPIKLNNLIGCQYFAIFFRVGFLQLNKPAPSSPLNVYSFCESPPTPPQGGAFHGKWRKRTPRQNVAGDLASKFPISSPSNFCDLTYFPGFVMGRVGEKIPPPQSQLRGLIPRVTPPSWFHPSFDPSFHPRMEARHLHICRLRAGVSLHDAGNFHHPQIVFFYMFFCNFC